MLCRTYTKAPQDSCDIDMAQRQKENHDLASHLKLKQGENVKIIPLNHKDFIVEITSKSWALNQRNIPCFH